MHEQQIKNVILRCYGNKHGTVFVLVAFLLTVLIGVAALAVDIGYVAISRNQLQNSTDAAALAGAGKLGLIYIAQTWPLSLNSTQEGEIKSVAIAVGQENEAAGQPPNIESSDVIIGYWNSSVNTFSNSPPSGKIPNAVRVIARPSASGSIPLGSVTTFFAKIFGISNVTVSATATASLTAPCDINPGAMAPFVLSYDHPYCDGNPDIVFTGTDPPPCAGWTTLDGVANTTNMRNLLNTLLTQNSCGIECAHGSTNYDIPSKEYEDTIYVMNGLNSTLWQCLQNLYLCARTKDNDNNDMKWTVSVPVVQRPCGQINQVPEIVSFATVEIHGITIGEGSNVKVEGLACVDSTHGSPCIKASVVCNKVIPEKGGGCAYYGTYGYIPGLVDKTAS